MSSFTERLLVPIRQLADEGEGQSQDNLLYNEHIVRYQLAGQLVKDKIVLDIACGSGYGAKMLADVGAAKVIAIDIDEAVIKQAEKQYQHSAIDFRADSAEILTTVADQSIDIVVSFETIEHLKNPDKFLQAVARVLKTDGQLLISTPNGQVFKNKNPYHIKEFTREEFVQILQKHWSEVKILEQHNALASYIIGTEEMGEADLIQRWGTPSTPLYFVALCGQRALAQSITGAASLNPAAWQKLQNNPVWRLANWAYGLLH